MIILCTVWEIIFQWEYGRGPEINMSGPRLIMSGPLPVMPGPSQLCRVPDLLCLNPYLCLGPEIIMEGPLSYYLRLRDNYVGPRLIMWGPRLTMSWPRDYYIGAPTMLGPPLVMSGPRDMGTLTYYVGAEIIIFGPRSMMLGPLLIMSGPQILYDIANIWFFLSHSYLAGVTAVELRGHLSIVNVCNSSNVSRQYWKIGNNGMKVIGLITPSHVRSKGAYLSLMSVHRNQYWVYGYRNSWWHMICAKHAAHNKKIEKTGLLGYSCCWPLQIFKDPPAWLNVVNTLKVWEWVNTFIPDFPDVRLLIHAGME